MGSDTTRFSCAPASALREEPLAGTATHVRTWLLLEHSGADAPQDVLPALLLEDDGLDAGPMQDVAEQQPRGAGSDDGDFRSHRLCLSRRWEGHVHRAGTRGSCGRAFHRVEDNYRCAPSAPEMPRAAIRTPSAN